MISAKEYPGVSIGGKHCYKDLDLVLTDVDIGMPEPQTSTTEIPGMDGVLDYTEVLTGHVRYKNRTITLTFATAYKFTKLDWSTFLSNLAGEIHGQKLKIIFDDDPEHYYYGRCTIGSFSSDWRNHTFKIICDCEPWKYDLNVTALSYRVEISSTTKCTLLNEQRPVVPTIYAAHPVNFRWNDKKHAGESYDLERGTNRELGIELAAGENAFVLTNESRAVASVVTFTFRGASL